jgi:hypothetical protein
MHQSDDPLQAHIDAHSERLRYYRRLSNAATDELWTLLSQRIVVDDSLDVSITRTLLLNSDEVRHVIRGADDVLLRDADSDSRRIVVPVPPADESVASRNDLELTSPMGTRRINSMPFNWFKGINCSEGFFNTRKQLPVPMALDELLSWPVIRLTIKTRHRQPVSGFLALRRFWPVSHVTVSEIGPVIATTTSLSVPAEAKVDIAAVGGTIELDKVAHVVAAEESLLRDSLDLVHLHKMPIIEQGADQRGVWLEILITGCNDALNGLQRVVTAGSINAPSSKNSSQSGASSSLAISKRLRKRADRGLEDIRERMTEIEDIRKRLTDMTEDRDIAEPMMIDDLSRKLQAACTKTHFTILTHRADSLLRTEELERPSNQDDGTKVSLDWWCLPFTSEPQIRFLRGLGILLLALASFMLIVSFLLHSLPPFLDDQETGAPSGPLSAVIWLVNHLNVGHYRRDGALLRTGIVTVLLLFPVVLYGGLFQARPVSVVAKRTAQYLYLFVQSLFAAPVLVAIIAASGLPLAWAWSAGYLSGVIALSTGLFIVFYFTTQRMGKLRHREAVRTLLYRTKHTKSKHI